MLGIGLQGAAREQAHGLGQERVLQRTQRSEDLLGGARAGKLDPTLEDDRAGVDTAVDEVDGHAEDLDPVGERLLDRVQTGEGGQQ